MNDDRKSDNSAFESLRQTISNLVSIPPLEWLSLIRCLRVKQLQKGELYFQQGEIFDEIGFIIKGLMYNFYLSDEGVETVKYVLAEKMPVSPYASILQNKPSPFSSKCIENTLLVTLKYSDLKKLYSQHPCWVNMGRVFAEQLFIRKEERERQLQMLSAQERYEIFIKDYKNVLNRIPQYMIASFLGITQVHLSRIRADQKKH